MSTRLFGHNDGHSNRENARILAGMASGAGIGM